MPCQSVHADPAQPSGYVTPMLESRSFDKDAVSWACEPRAIPPRSTPLILTPLILTPLILTPLILTPFIFVEATAAFGLPLADDPVESCSATVGRLPLLSRRMVPMPAGVLVLPGEGFAVAVAFSVTEVSDAGVAGIASVAWSEALAGSPSLEETVTELSNGVFSAMVLATVAGSDT